MGQLQLDRTAAKSFDSLHKFLRAISNELQTISNLLEDEQKNTKSTMALLSSYAKVEEAFQEIHCLFGLQPAVYDQLGKDVCRIEDLWTTAGDAQLGQRNVNRTGLRERLRKVAAQAAEVSDRIEGVKHLRDSSFSLPWRGTQDHRAMLTLVRAGHGFTVDAADVGQRESFMIEEYKNLRGEIDMRIQLQHQILNYVVVVFAAILTVAFGEKLTTGAPLTVLILLVYPLLALGLTIGWVHNSSHTMQLGRYIYTIETQATYFGWEHFLYRLRTSGKSAIILNAHWAFGLVFVSSQLAAMLLAFIERISLGVGLSNPRDVPVIALFLADLTATCLTIYILLNGQPLLKPVYYYTLRPFKTLAVQAVHRAAGHK